MVLGRTPSSGHLRAATLAAFLTLQVSPKTIARAISRSLNLSSAGVLPRWRDTPHSSEGSDRQACRRSWRSGVAPQDTFNLKRGRQRFFHSKGSDRGELRPSLHRALRDDAKSAVDHHIPGLFRVSSRQVDSTRLDPPAIQTAGSNATVALAGHDRNRAVRADLALGRRTVSKRRRAAPRRPG